MLQSTRRPPLRCSTAKENAMIERGVLDEASSWPQSLLFMVNIFSLDKSGTYLPPAYAKDMLE